MRQADEDIAQDRLGDTRAQGGEDAAAGTGRTEQLVGLNEHVAEGDAAAVGLTLAHIVPVVVDVNAVAAGGQDHHLQLGVAGQRGRDEQQIGVLGASAEGFLAAQAEGAIGLWHRVVRGSSGFSELPQKRFCWVVSVYQRMRCSGVPMRCGVIAPRW